MRSLTATSTGPRWPRLRRFTIDVAITQVFNVAIALVVTYVLRVHPIFFNNLVISVCVGTTMVTTINGGRLLLWGLDKPPSLPFSLLFAAAVPGSFYLGNALGAWILGIAPEQIASSRTANPLGFYLMFLFICVGITWFFWTRSRVEMLKADAEAEKARTAAVEKQAMQAQLQLLQAQIEPHMLFNTLANLQGLIAFDPPRAQAMLDQLIRYLRATLSSARAETTTLAQEFALLDAFLGLMQVRMDTRLAYGLQLPDELRTVALPPMLLQPLVENAIKHGLEPKIEGGRVDVSAAREHGCLTLIVSDTGLGLEQGQPPKTSGGVGLANVRERLHALYGARASLDLQPNHPCGLRAVLTLPL